jgi:uncharacterized membrane protein YbhN (UPF0104 family)
MALPALSAHAICVGLVVTDVLARAVRLRRVLAALGDKVGLPRLAATTLSCDAACALTPYRAGGDALRLASLARAGVPLRHSLAAVGYESLQSWPVVLLCGAALAWAYGAQWGRAVVAGLRAWSGAAPWIVLALAVPLLAGLGVYLRRRFRRHGPMETTASIGKRILRSAALLRVTVPLTLASMAARGLVLPVLAATLEGAPPFGQSALGSFALLHSQMVLPLPAGVGAVDLGFLAGVRGAGNAGALLLWWRVYTTGVGLVLGLAALPLTFGRRRSAPAPTRPISDASASLGAPSRRSTPRSRRSCGWRPRTPEQTSGCTAAPALTTRGRGGRSPPPSVRRGAGSTPGAHGQGNAPAGRTEGRQGAVADPQQQNDDRDDDVSTRRISASAPAPAAAPAPVDRPAVAPASWP